MVVNCPSEKPLPLRRDWYPDALWTRSWPSPAECEQFLDGLDVVFSCETFYRSDFPVMARNAGVRTMLQPNFELFDQRIPRPDLLVPGSLWRFDEFPDPKQHLPVPVATERFTANDAHRPTRFLHIVGRPAVHDRNGTRDLLQALQYVTAKVTVTVKCQMPEYVEAMPYECPPNVELSIDTGDTENYWDNYASHHVLVMPRRYGGLCLPANEALAAGMPVIMPDIEPNNGWLPAEWLVPARCHRWFMAKAQIDVHATDPQALAAKIDQFAMDPRMYQRAKNKAAQLATSLSWDVLKPRYEQVLTSVLEGVVL